MAQIRRIWVERSVSSLRWKDFNAELSGEWSNITIYVRSLSYLYDSGLMTRWLVNCDVGCWYELACCSKHSALSLSDSTGHANFCYLYYGFHHYVRLSFPAESQIWSCICRQSSEFESKSQWLRIDYHIKKSFLLEMTDSFFGTKALAFVYSLPLVLLAWGWALNPVRVNCLINDETP